MRLLNKMVLRDRLNHNNYEKIAVWKNGTWADVGRAYIARESGDGPVCYIRREYHGEMTHRAITDLFHEIETVFLRE